MPMGMINYIQHGMPMGSMRPMDGQQRGEAYFVPAQGMMQQQFPPGQYAAMRGQFAPYRPGAGNMYGQAVPMYGQPGSPQPNAGARGSMRPTAMGHSGAAAGGSIIAGGWQAQPANPPAPKKSSAIAIVNPDTMEEVVVPKPLAPASDAAIMGAPSSALPSASSAIQMQQPPPPPSDPPPRQPRAQLQQPPEPSPQDTFAGIETVDAEPHATEAASEKAVPGAADTAPSLTEAVVEAEPLREVSASVVEETPAETPAVDGGVDTTIPTAADETADPEPATADAEEALAPAATETQEASVAEESEIAASSADAPAVTEITESATPGDAEVATQPEASDEDQAEAVAEDDAEAADDGSAEPTEITAGETAGGQVEAVTGVAGAENDDAAESKEDGDDEDDWESKDESQLVIESPKTKPAAQVSLRPGGAMGSVNFPSASKHAVLAPGTGKKVYPRDFLLKFHSIYTDKPSSLPNMEVVVGEEKTAGQPARKGPPQQPNAEEWRTQQKRAGPSNPPSRSGSVPTKINNGFVDPRSDGNQFSRVNQRRDDRRRNPPPRNPPIDVKPLQQTENRYVAISTSGKAVDDQEKLIRTTKSLLNKLSPEKFDKLCEQFLDLEIESRASMVSVIDLVFDKALFEPVFGTMYSSLCVRCAEKFPEFPDEKNPSGKPHTFKRLLLNKCQEEFEKENYVQAELDALPPDTPDEVKESIVKKAKRRMLGNIRFIGELYKQRMLTEKIMHECLIKLLGDIEQPEEESVECLCKLMTTIGKSIDHQRAKSHMDEYFTRMTEMSRNPGLANRLRFMLQEVIELRRGGWIQRKADPSAKQITQPREDAARDDRGGAGRGGRIQAGSGDVRKEVVGAGSRGGPPAGRGAPPPAARQASGPPGKGGKGGGDASASAAPKAAPPLTSDEVSKRLESDLEEYLECGDVNELITCLSEVAARAPKSDDSVGKQLASLAISKTFDARGDGPRRKVAAAFGPLHQARLLTPADLQSCFADILEFIDDEVMDVPHIATYMGSFIAAAICDGILPLTYLNEAFAHLVDCEGVSAITMATEVLLVVISCKGDEEAQSMYKREGVKLLDLLPEDKRSSPTAVADLMESKGLAALDPPLVRCAQQQREEEQREQAKAATVAQKQQLDDFLAEALRSEMPGPDILQWMTQHCDGSIEVTRTVIRKVLESAVPDDAKQLTAAIKRNQTLLKAYNNQPGDTPSQLKRQAHCLFEVQAFCHDKGFPPGLINKLFYQLYEEDIIFEDSYGIWREDLLDETPGKQTALFQARTFLEWLESAEEGEEGEEGE